MPFVQITWLPKACRNAAVRKEVADAVMKAMCSVKGAEISPANLVVRFGEAVDAFPLPKGFSENEKFQGHPKEGAPLGLGARFGSTALSGGLPQPACFRTGAGERRPPRLGSDDPMSPPK
ncbi:hypothetical protein M885DRAFT_448631 [Pelagophyceae sp. CCMP2097]|nr:hypothetical protein M885DRAFT_448631 [Pelagophyceae sp. CCMP2097]